MDRCWLAVSAMEISASGIEPHGSDSISSKVILSMYPACHGCLGAKCWLPVPPILSSISGIWTRENFSAPLVATFRVFLVWYGYPPDRYWLLALVIRPFACGIPKAADNFA